MRDRINLLHATTAAFTGRVAPPETIDLRELPLIAPGALDLPPGIQARLMGTDTIILWHRATELHLEMPLTAMADPARYVAALEGAAMRHACGEAPDAAGGYWVGGDAP